MGCSRAQGGAAAPDAFGRRVPPVPASPRAGAAPALLASGLQASPEEGAKRRAHQSDDARGAFGWSHRVLGLAGGCPQSWLEPQPSPWVVGNESSERPGTVLP